MRVDRALDQTSQEAENYFQWPSHPLGKEKSGAPKASAGISYHFQYDFTYKVLLLRFLAAVTDRAIWQAFIDTAKMIASTGAIAVIIDFTSVKEHDVSAAAARALGESPPSGKLLETIFIIVAPRPDIFGLARLFEAHAAENMPSLAVVRNMEEALAMLRVSEPHFQAVKCDE
jgi:hypothetical protein